MTVKATTGGGALAVTTTEATLDLQALMGCYVAIWSTDQNILYCGSDAATGTLVTGAAAASLTSLKADQNGKGVKSFRFVAHRYLIAKTDTGSGVLHVKVVDKPVVTGIGGY